MDLREHMTGVGKVLIWIVALALAASALVILVAFTWAAVRWAVVTIA